MSSTPDHAGRVCDLPGCHGPVPRPTSRYCCTEHTRAGRNLANIRSRAVAAERKVLQDALDGKTEPPEHVGWLTTSKGVVLTGRAVLELHETARLLRAAAADAADAAGQPGANYHRLRNRVGGVRQAAVTAADALDRLLRAR